MNSILLCREPILYIPTKSVISDDIKTSDLSVRNIKGRNFFRPFLRLADR